MDGIGTAIAVQRWTGSEASLLRRSLRKSVRSFAAFLGVAVRTVSKWEELGEQTEPRPEMQAVLDTALARAPEDARALFYRFLDSERSGYGDPRGAPVAYPERPSLQSLDSVARILQENIRANGYVGSPYLIPAVQGQAALLDRLLEVARGRDRKKVLRVAADLAEFCGWLYQDSGDLPRALAWTNLALDHAEQLDDLHLRSYFFMRKSNIVMARGANADALALANVALTPTAQLTDRLKAVAFRQRANVHAILSDRKCFEAEFELAVDSAVDGQSAPDDIDKAPYCTPSYVEMEAGIAWVDLGQPHKATQLLEHSLAMWPQAERPLERGVCLARISVAYAACGEVQEACVAADQALAISRQSGSARIRNQLIRASELLEPFNMPVGYELKRKLGVDAP